MKSSSYDNGGQSIFIGYLLLLGMITLILSLNPDKWIAITVIIIGIVSFLFLKYFGFGKDLEVIYAIIVVDIFLIIFKFANMIIDANTFLKFCIVPLILSFIGYMLFSEKISPQHVFNWTRFSTNDREKLKEFLTYEFCNDWIKIEDFKKSSKNDDDEIDISGKVNSLSLKYNKNSTEVTLKINDCEKGKFIAKMENNDLNVYSPLYSRKLQHFLKNFKGLMASTLILLYFVFILFSFNYMPLNYVIEPKKFEANISLANDSNNSIMTLTIENFGANLTNVSIDFQGNSLGIQSTTEKFKQMRENFTRINQTLRYLIDNRTSEDYNKSAYNIINRSANNIAINLISLQQYIYQNNSFVNYNESAYDELNKYATFITSDLVSMKSEGLKNMESRKKLSFSVTIGLIRDNVSCINQTLKFLTYNTTSTSSKLSSYDKIDNHKRNISNITNDLTHKIWQMEDNASSINLTLQYLINNRTSVTYNKSSYDKINKSFANISYEMDKNDILVSIVPTNLGNIGSGETRSVSIKVEAAKNACCGIYIGFIRIYTANKDVLETVPLKLKVDLPRPDASKSNKSTEPNPASTEYNVNLNINKS